MRQREGTRGPPGPSQTLVVRRGGTLLQSVKKQIYVLPDGNITTTSAERLQCHERLFQPSFFGRDGSRLSVLRPAVECGLSPRWCVSSTRGAQFHSAALSSLAGCLSSRR